VARQVTIGRTVLYRLTAEDAHAINRSLVKGMPEDSRVADVNIGNPERAGSILPMVVVRVWPDAFGRDPSVNGQVLLDGNGVMWVQSVSEGAEPGQWHWPEMV